MIAMQDIKKRVQVHIPFHRLRGGHLDRIVKDRMNPEISFAQPVLDNGSKDDFRRVADILREAGLTVTFHAPFMDLRPGAVDPKIRQATVERLRQVFDLAPYFLPKSIVCHASFDERYYVSADQVWLENSIATWAPFLSLAEELDTLIAFENVYETGPRQLKMLLDAFPSPRACLCFDVPCSSWATSRSWERKPSISSWAASGKQTKTSVSRYGVAGGGIPSSSAAAIMTRYLPSKVTGAHG